MRLQLQIEAQRDGWMIGGMQASRLHTSFDPIYSLAFAFFLFLFSQKNILLYFFLLVPLSLGFFRTEIVLFDHNQGRWIQPALLAVEKVADARQIGVDAAITSVYVVDQCFYYFSVEFYDMVIVPLLTRFVYSFSVWEYLVCMTQNNIYLKPQNLR